jgi:hypothetical protein
MRRGRHARPDQQGGSAIHHLERGDGLARASRKARLDQMTRALSVAGKVEAEQARAVGCEMLGQIPDPFTAGGTGAMQ